MQPGAKFHEQEKKVERCCTRAEKLKPTNRVSNPLCATSCEGPKSGALLSFRKETAWLPDKNGIPIAHFLDGKLAFLEREII
jgi:hypothetical protein